MHCDSAQQPPCPTLMDACRPGMCHQVLTPDDVLSFSCRSQPTGHLMWSVASANATHAHGLTVYTKRRILNSNLAFLVTIFLVCNIDLSYNYVLLDIRRYRLGLIPWDLHSAGVSECKALMRSLHALRQRHRDPFILNARLLSE
jgi:hypothetical protein